MNSTRRITYRYKVNPLIALVSALKALRVLGVLLAEVILEGMLMLILWALTVALLGTLAVWLGLPAELGGWLLWAFLLSGGALVTWAGWN